MAYTTVTFTNGIQTKKAPIGFSWTTFFWGGIPALTRQDWVAGIVLLILCILTWGLAGIVAAFFYNKIYAVSLVNKGYYIHALPADLTKEKLMSELGLLKFPNE